MLSVLSFGFSVITKKGDVDGTGSLVLVHRSVSSTDLRL